MNIYGEKVMLRAMEPEDMEMLRETINDPATEEMVGGWSYPVSKLRQEQWYRDVINSEETVRFSICSKQDGRLWGMIYLADIDWKSRQASYGIKLVKGVPRSQGIATDAELSLFQFVFEEMGLHRLNSEVVEYNAASIKMTERCGAKREGIKRQALYKHGSFHNVICYGLLYEDYLDARTKLGWNGYSEN